jgi:starvation-inducible DNA-binding protein
MNLGLNPKTLHKNAEILKKVLADTYTLYLKTQNYHWNVTGLNFHSLHTLFEMQYTELALAVDLLAERIRALGEKAPGSFAEFSRLTSIKEASGDEKAEQMIANLAADHETLAKALRADLINVSENHDDATQDVLTERAGAHEKTAWMLRATLG